MGRFLSRDPIGHAGGLNLYEYSRSNPVTYTDYTGLNPFSFTGGSKSGKYNFRVVGIPGIIDTGLDGGKVTYGATIDVTNYSTSSATFAFKLKNVQALIVTDLTKNKMGVLKEITDARLENSNCDPLAFTLGPGGSKSVNIRMELAIDPKDLPKTTWKMTVPLEVETHTGRWSLRPPFYHDMIGQTTFTLKQRFIVDKNGATTQSSEF